MTENEALTDYWVAFENLASASTEPRVEIRVAGSYGSYHSDYYALRNDGWYDVRASYRPSYRSLKALWYGEDCEDMLIALPCAYGDYLGSDFDAANSRYLTENYAFVRTEGDDTAGVSTIVSVLSGSLGVVDGEAPEATTEEIVALTHEIESLSDYPLLDDDTHSEYIAELTEASWDAYRWGDLVSTIGDRFHREYNGLIPAEDHAAFETMLDVDMTDEEIDAVKMSYEREAWWVGESGTATGVINDANDESEDAAYRRACELWSARQNRVLPCGHHEGAGLCGRCDSAVRPWYDR
jgi:hypothetical protein